PEGLLSVLSVRFLWRSEDEERLGACRPAAPPAPARSRRCRATLQAPPLGAAGWEEHCRPASRHHGPRPARSKPRTDLERVTSRAGCSLDWPVARPGPRDVA